METTNNVVELATEKPYTLRNVDAKDMGLMATIISKIGWKEFKTAFKSDELEALFNGGNVTEDEAGMVMAFDIAGIVLANYEKCQNDIFRFLSNLSGLDVKQIESFSPADFAEMVFEVVEKKEFKDFFTVVVSKLFK